MSCVLNAQDRLRDLNIVQGPGTSGSRSPIGGDIMKIKAIAMTLYIPLRLSSQGDRN